MRSLSGQWGNFTFVLLCYIILSKGKHWDNQIGAKWKRLFARTEHLRRMNSYHRVNCKKHADLDQGPIPTVSNSVKRLFTMWQIILAHLQDKNWLSRMIFQADFFRIFLRGSDRWPVIISEKIHPRWRKRSDGRTTAQEIGDSFSAQRKWRSVQEVQFNLQGTELTKIVIRYVVCQSLRRLTVRFICFLKGPVLGALSCPYIYAPLCSNIQSGSWDEFSQIQFYSQFLEYRISA